MRVVVAEAPALEKRYDNSYPSLGVLYIISYLRHAIPGIEVKYLESNCNLKQHIDYLRNFKPSIYGISVTSKTLRLAAATIAAVREQFPDTVVVCGGPHPTALPQQTLQITNADIVVKGEGEETFVEIVKALENRTDLADVPGITFKAKERIFDNPNRPLIKKPRRDTLPRLGFSGSQKISRHALEDATRRKFTRYFTGLPLQLHLLLKPRMETLQAMAAL